MQHSEVIKSLSTGPSGAGAYYEPTPEDVKAIYAYFSKKYGTKYIDKDDDELMKFISLFLGIGKGMTRDGFLQNFVTTIGRKIYLPYEIGVPGEDGKWSLWGQIITCVHEHEHVIQYDHTDTKSAFGFSRQYLLKKRRRTRFEIEAYTTALELHYWRFGVLRDIESLVNSLSAYHVSELDIKVARKSFDLNNEMIGNGAVITKASFVAIEWFRSRGVSPK